MVHLLGGGLPAPLPDLSQQNTGQLARQLHHNLATSLSRVGLHADPHGGGLTGHVRVSGSDTTAESRLLPSGHGCREASPMISVSEVRFLEGRSPLFDHPWPLSTEPCTTGQQPWPLQLVAGNQPIPRHRKGYGPLQGKSIGRQNCGRGLTWSPT